MLPRHARGRLVQRSPVTHPKSIDPRKQSRPLVA
jgi:hypothetical protein